ncbi:hypothetical protein FGO68_gene13205 [Halteria grandinella]|uniref:Uncharacterized protein n=1 Tax=Halteria grandinella TaxID=5974 RepID=A0A8J8NFG8_HALGN|nr:hypothetical protein FGO68_gene13205 [Halteria grandinella]
MVNLSCKLTGCLLKFNIIHCGETKFQLHQIFFQAANLLLTSTYAFKLAMNHNIDFLKIGRLLKFLCSLLP